MRLTTLLIALTLIAGGVPAVRAADTPAPSSPAPKTAMLAGRNTIRYIPASPKGIVYLFHGTGGSENFATRIHSKIVLDRLVANGFGYAAAPSADRTASRGNLESIDPKTNVDVAYMLALHRALIASGEIADQTPVFSMGMSNGGGFSNLFAIAALAQGLPVKAIGDYMGPIPAPARTPPPGKAYPPLFIVLGDNDGLVAKENVEPVADRLKASGTRVEMHVVHEGLVNADTFKTIPGLTDKDREEILTALVERKVIDAAGKRLVFKDKPKIGQAEIMQLNTMPPAGSHQRDIANQLLIAWGSHQMRSDFAEQQVAFFVAALKP